LRCSHPAWVLIMLGFLVVAIVMVWQRCEPWEVRHSPPTQARYQLEMAACFELAELLVPDVLQAFADANRAMINAIALSGAARLLEAPEPAAAYAEWLAMLPVLVRAMRLEPPAITCRDTGRSPEMCLLRYLRRVRGGETTHPYTARSGEVLRGPAGRNHLP
jgi:hypothetical protein